MKRFLSTVKPERVQNIGKSFFRYPRVIQSYGAEPMKPGQILIEVNTFANPYPFEIKSVSSFIYDFLLRQNAEDVIEEYELQPFLLPVLDKRRTLTEKIVSLLRYSLAQDYIKEMSAKIRHFYDIHFLINDAEVYQYFTSDDFLRDFTSLFTEDQERFEQPDGWHHRGGNSIYGLLVMGRLCRIARRQRLQYPGAMGQQRYPARLYAP